MDHESYSTEMRAPVAGRPRSDEGLYPQREYRGALIAARQAAGLTQADLAARVGTTQSAIARMEGGAVTPTVDTLCRLSDVLGIRFTIAPNSGLVALPAECSAPTLREMRARRKEIMRIGALHGARNLRVFGSVARGEAGPESDVDFLVELDQDRTVLDLSSLILDLREALGRAVHVVEARESSPVAESIRREAVAL